MSGPYRIAVVAELTGVPEPTIRAWERRYDVPTPRRTPSGYRLYGDREVEQVRHMRALCESGVAAAEAAKLVAKERRAPNKEIGARDALDAAAQAILRAVERFDEDALDCEVRRLPYVGSALAVIERVIVPVLRTIGDRWFAGEISVAQEHLVAQKLDAVMHDFVRLAPGGDRVALVACMAEEQHHLGALAVAVYLATWGVRPVFFGARTPPDALARAVVALRPSLVALSVTMTPDREHAKELVNAYADACGRVRWVVGGVGSGAISDLVREAGGAAIHDTANFEAWMRRSMGG